MMAAAPRKKANGDVSIRPYLTGTSSGTRDSAWPSSTATGSRRRAEGTQSAWLPRGTSLRAARPRAARSAGEIACWAGVVAGSSVDVMTGDATSRHTARHHPDGVKPLLRQAHLD